jgi:hypothetical protein
VYNNPLTYLDPSGFWRISVSFHAGVGGHFAYDSDTGHVNGGIGVGVGGGVSVGDNNWDVGASNEIYCDVGYDNKLDSAYVTAKYGQGVQGPSGQVYGGAGASGTYYLNADEFVVSGGVGYGGVGVNAGYSSFGEGSWSLGGNIGSIGANYNYGSKKWSYSYTLDVEALNNDYKSAKVLRGYNGYGAEGGPEWFNGMVDYLGTIAAGFKPADIHDGGYTKRGKATVDFDLFTSMIVGSVSNIQRTNGLFRASLGLVLSPLYYTAVTVGGGDAYKAAQAQARAASVR